MKGKNALFKTLFPYIAITIGATLASAGYVFLIFPLNLFEGGITGVGLLANKTFGVPIGTTGLIITLFIYVIATKILGKSFGVKSIYATVLVFGFIDLFPLIYSGKVTNDVLLASFYGALLTGTGMGIVFSFGASTGGSDAIAQIMKKLYCIPIGRSLIAVDFIVLSVATFYVGVEKIMYSFLFIFIQIKVVDTILNGLEANQKITIITSETEKVKAALLGRLERGITIYKATGAYTDEEKSSLITVVSKKQTPVIKRIVSEIDAKVFVIIEDVHQVYGEGFQKLRK